MYRSIRIGWQNVILAQKIMMSTTSESQSDLLAYRKNGHQVFVLNRPKVFNAFSLEMNNKFRSELEKFEQSDDKRIVLVKSSHPKIFSSGGDMKDTLNKLKTRDPALLEFGRKQYQLMHFIATLKKPYVAIINGCTMGAGVGLSVHAPFRISTENTVVAMPETKIGYFPDVGTSFFLPRMDGETGIYLGLTGKRIWARIYAGFATHYVHSNRLPELEDELMRLETNDLEMIKATIERFSATPSGRPYSLGVHREAIDRCFKFECLKETCIALEKENTAWSKETLNTLRQMSPTSTQVSLLHLRAARGMSLANSIRGEYDLAQKCAFHNDFHEGITALLVERRQPVWSPANIEDLSLDDIKNEYFVKKSPSVLSLLNHIDYMEYPHRHVALPNEYDVCEHLPTERASMPINSSVLNDILNRFIQKKMVDSEILNRYQETINNGQCAL
ncbi:ClpP/crotonase-like domain-containing protein [Syncephalis plumigaleata]|nr:ClpP/crotonase-like domain-containing protein [Syncephalis plumigaleata]